MDKKMGRNMNERKKIGKREKESENKFRKNE